MSDNTTLLQNEQAYYAEAFSRNLFTKEEQALLRKSTIAIGGLGAVGEMYAMSFARLGISNFRISDLDVFNIVNMNRQVGATVANLDRSKTEVTKEIILSINPFASVKTFEGGITPKDIDEFLNGADVVLDGMDFFNPKMRRLMYNKAREHGLYVIGAAPIGYGSSLMVVDPKGMSFDEYFDMRDNMSEEDMLVRFAMGLAPALIQKAYFMPNIPAFKAGKALSLVTGVLACGSFVTCETVKLLTGKKVLTIPTTSQFDPYVRKFKQVTVRRGNRALMQRIKISVMTKRLKKVGAPSQSSA